MRPTHGVAFLDGDTVRAAVRCGDPQVIESRSVSALVRENPHVQWLTDRPADELARLMPAAPQLLPDHYLGVRVPVILAEWGYSDWHGRQAAEAALILAGILGRTISAAQRILQTTHFRSLVDAAESLVDVSQHERSDIGVLGDTISPLPPKEDHVTVMPFREHRLDHARALLEMDVPAEPFQRITLPISIDQAARERIIVRLRGPEALRTFDLRSPPPSEQIIAAWGAAGTTTASQRFRVPDHVLGPVDDTPWACGPLNVRGRRVLHYSVGLVAESLWRALTRCCDTAGAWLYVREREITQTYALRVAQAIDALRLRQTARVMTASHGIVWVAIASPRDCEDTWTIAANIAVHANLLPPALPPAHPGSPRYRTALGLLRRILRRRDLQPAEVVQAALISTHRTAACSLQ
jgi:hypothetical protein